MELTNLVEKAKAGDKDALIKLVIDKKSEYYKLAYVYTQNKEDALDAMEDMIVILHEKIKQLKDEQAFYSWSKTILVNCCKKIMKKNSKLVLVDKFEEEGYIDKYEASEQGIDIKEQLNCLNKHQQEAIKLRYFLDMDYKTIAEVTKVSEGTVKSRISIGLKKLKERLGGEY